MLTLCEDAIQDRGKVEPTRGAVYYRLISSGLSDAELARYAHEAYAIAQEIGPDARFPEAVLQKIDDDWLTEYPTPQEGSFYRINPYYLRYLLNQLGDGSGRTLERLAQYLMSSMPECRTRTRERSGSTEYDVICTMEGFDLDFRSELGPEFYLRMQRFKGSSGFQYHGKVRSSSGFHTVKVRDLIF